jgi:hypothetical protein
MTAAQLAHLAEMPACAADYFAVSDAGDARIFGDASRRARSLSAELLRDETEARHRGAISSRRDHATYSQPGPLPPW